MEFAPFLMLLVLSSQWSTRVESVSYGDLPEGSEIIQCIVVYRHGDRTPIKEYPTSKYKDISSWGGIGWGQLTLTGMKQHYRFGRWLMEEYGPSGKGLLQSDYDYRDYKIWSTDVDRTIMSGLANSAGLYRPPIDQQIAYGTDWNPIPLRAIPANSHDMIFGQQCPLAQEMTMINLEFYFKRMLKEDSDFIDYAEKNSGFDIRKKPTNIFLLSDSINIENITFNEIPEWAKSIYPEPLQTMYLKYFQSYTKTLEQKRLTAGPLLKTIIGTMVDKTQGLGTAKLLSYSGHDTNVFSILSALGMEPTELLKYTCAIFFDLYKTPSNGYYVQTRFRSGPDTTPVSLMVPGCGATYYCKLETLVNITAKLIPENLQDECKQLKPNTLEFNELLEELLSTYF